VISYISITEPKDKLKPFGFIGVVAYLKYSKKLIQSLEKNHHGVFRFFFRPVFVSVFVDDVVG